jgi:hypothetical protein
MPVPKMLSSSVIDNSRSITDSSRVIRMTLASEVSLMTLEVSYFYDIGHSLGVNYAQTVFITLAQVLNALAKTY